VPAGVFQVYAIWDREWTVFWTILLLSIAHIAQFPVPPSRRTLDPDSCQDPEYAVRICYWASIVSTTTRSHQKRSERCYPVRVVAPASFWAGLSLTWCGLASYVAYRLGWDGNDSAAQTPIQSVHLKGEGGRSSLPPSRQPSKSTVDEGDALLPVVDAGGHDRVKDPDGHSMWFLVGSIGNSDRQEVGRAARASVDRPPTSATASGITSASPRPLFTMPLSPTQITTTKGVINILSTTPAGPRAKQKLGGMFTDLVDKDDLPEFYEVRTAVDV